MILSVGHFDLRWYSLILLTAIVVGIWLAARQAARKGFKKDDIYDAAVWIIVGGLVGAR
jgi:phosphatidylglycerol:prolipoprotein diacylglycerol transferase